MYRLPRIRLQVVREGFVASATRTVHGPADAARVAQDLIADLDRECVIAIMLDIRHRVIGLHTVAVGSLTSCPVHPASVFKAAMLTNAAAIIMVHNHPSGSLGRSRADEDLTARIVAAGRLLGIDVLDHLIVTDSGFVSLRQVDAWPEGVR